MHAVFQVPSTTLPLTTYYLTTLLPAAGIRRSTCSAAEAVYLEPRDDQLAPDPARCFDCPVDPAPAAQ